MRPAARQGIWQQSNGELMTLRGKPMHIHEYHAFCVAFVDDPTCRACFFTMESTSFKSKFIAQLNNSFGSGGMSLAFNDNQFSLFLQFLKKKAGRNFPSLKLLLLLESRGTVQFGSLEGICSLMRRVKSFPTLSRPICGLMRRATKHSQCFVWKKFCQLYLFL